MATGLQPDNSVAALHAYTSRYMDNARLQWQVLKPHTSSLQSLAVAGIQTACSHARAVALLQWQDSKLHARPPARAVALLQWQDTKLHARMRAAAALLQ
jgi:hypothetical protein